MSLSTRILIIIGVILLIGGVGFIIFKEIENSQRQDAIQKQMVAQKELIDGIVRSQSQYTTKEDLEKFIKDNNVNLKAIQDDLDKLDANITAANVAIANSQGQHGINIPSTGTGGTNPTPNPPTCSDGKPCPNADPFGYNVKEQTLALNENFGTTQVPFGQVGFSAWQQKPWSVDIKPRQYSLVNVIGKDENERLYVYNKFSVNVDGKTYNVPITSAETKQEYPTAKFSFWNPRLFITAGGGINATELPVNGNFNAGATIGIMSYGKYKSAPDISILQVGAGYSSNNNDFAVIINPVSFNIGSVLPTNSLIKNTYIGPSVQITPSGNVFVGANLSVGL